MNLHTLSMDDKVLRHGAYLVLPARLSCQGAEIPQLTQRFELSNEFHANGKHPDRAIAFLRRVKAFPGDIDDRVLLDSQAVIHVAAESGELIYRFCRLATRLLGGKVRVRIGVVRPKLYTGGEMERFAYDHQVQQQSGTSMRNVFIVPMTKTQAWWSKDWMERHTYFLPRYDDHGVKVNDGHALAAEPGVAHLYRRTYKYTTLPAPEGEYDFLNYFECADSGIRIFHEVCASLRDTRRNPEWRFVREGPTWQGRRVATWQELFA